jgi:hypothetical protein
MNPYYATGFMTALICWVWPAFLFKNLDAHWLTVVAVSGILFLGAGKLASEFHISVIAPKKPPRGPATGIAAVCAAVFVLGVLTRIAYHYAAVAPS